MRIFIILSIILFCFSSAFAFDDDMSFGLYGYGYIPMETDKNLIGYGGGGGFKLQYNLNKYFAIGASTGFTVSTSNYNNTKNITLLSDSRFLVIFQRNTYKGESGFVPWGSIGFGFLTGSGKYGDFQSFEDAMGFNFTLAAGLRYNFSRTYIGFGAEYSIARLYGDLYTDYYNNYYYYQRKSSAIMNPSGFNIFGEFGFRF